MLFTFEVIEAGHFWAHYGTQETFQLLQTLQHDINAMGGANLSVCIFHFFVFFKTISFL